MNFDHIMAKKKEQKEKSLEQTLYDTAELQRGKVAPSDYKDIALGLLFLKFISYWYDQRRAEIEKETKDESEKNRNYLLNLKKNYTSKGVFFLKKVTDGMILRKLHPVNQILQSKLTKYFNR